MRKQTQVLSEEHKNILKVISALEKECGSLKLKKEINKEFFKNAIDFIRNYSDKFHHAKEEDILFVEFCKEAHKAHCNPVDQMLHEHKLGREFVKNMEEGLNRNDPEVIAENGLQYAGLLKDHILKEDTILYPMIDEVLDEKTQQSIMERAKSVERKKFKKEILDKYLEFSNNPE